MEIEFDLTLMPAGHGNGYYDLFTMCGGDLLVVRYNDEDTIFENTDDIQKLLNSTRYRPVVDNGLSFALLDESGRIVATHRSYDIAAAITHYGVRFGASFEEELVWFRAYKRDNGLTLDHADGHKRNNTAANLSLMEGKLNTSKGLLTQRFARPLSLTTAHVDGKYLVRYTSPVDQPAFDSWQDAFIEWASTHNASCIWRLFADDPASFLGILQYLASEKLPWSSVGAKEKRNGYWAYRGRGTADSLTGNLYDAILLQRILVHEYRAGCHFSEYRKVPAVIQSA